MVLLTTRLTSEKAFDEVILKYDTFPTTQENLKPPLKKQNWKMWLSPISTM